MLLQLEDRLAPGNGLSGADIALMAMGGGGLFVQSIVRDLVGGPNLVSPEGISLAKPGPRGDIGSAAPAHNAPAGDKFLPSPQSNANQSAEPKSREPLTAQQQSLGHFFATVGDSLPSDSQNALFISLDNSAPQHPHGGGAGHKIADGAGNGGGAKSGSLAPPVNAERSAGAGRGATPTSNNSNYLTNSAEASALQTGGPAAAAGPHGSGSAATATPSHTPAPVPSSPTHAPDPVITANPQTGLAATEGQAFSTVIGSFTDSQNPPPSSLSVIVNWGDGSALDSSAIITATGGGTYLVSGSHTYARESSDTIQEYVRDGNGNEGTISNTANLVEAPLTVAAPTLYGPPISLSAGNTPDSAGTLKLDNGQELVLVANFYGNSVTVQKSNGDGTFTSLGTLPTGNGPNGFAVGNFGNGHQDFAIGNYYSNTVTVYLGDGTGHFTAGPTLATGSGPANEMAIGDFAGNGKLDLATANQNDGTVSVFLGNGNGTFQNAVNYNVGAGIDAITAGDFRGNGRLDLAVGNYNTSTVTVLQNQGNGTFTVGSPIPVGSNPWYMTAADLNGNGKDDLATANFGSANVSVLLSNGNDTFQSAVNYAVGANPTGVLAAGVGGNGLPDLLTSNYGSNNASVLLGNGDGTFQAAQNFAAGSGPNGIAVGDLTGTGKADIVVADQNSNSASVLLNQTLQATIGQPFTGAVASFSDADATQPGQYTAAINWGDGTPLDVHTQIIANPGHFNVIGTHTYKVAGNLPIKVSIQDGGHSTATANDTMHVRGPIGGAGKITLNQIENPSETGFISVNGGPKEDVYLTQFLATYTSNSGGQKNFQTFCVDLTHNVSQGQTFAVNPRADLSSAFAGGSEIAYIYQNYGELNLSNNSTQAAAVQLAIWFEMQSPNAAGIAPNTDGSYSVPGQENRFAVTFNSSGQAAAVVPLINSYMAAAQNSNLKDYWDDAAAAGYGQNRGQSMLEDRGMALALNSTAQDAQADPQSGNALLRQGNNSTAVPINTSQNPKGCNCGCTTATANDPSLASQLTYNSIQVGNRPVIQAQVPTPPSDATPTSITAQLTFNGNTQPAQTFAVPSFTPGQPLNLAVQTANPVTHTGRYGWSLALTMTYPNGLGTVTKTITGTSFVVAQDHNAVGAGWSYGMIDQLIPIPADANGPAGVMRVYGTGGSRFYQSNGDGTFQSPAGDNGTLVQNGDGSYTYRTPGGVTFNFNSAGQETSQVSTCGCIQYTFTYDGSGNLATMTSTDGAYSTFNYSNGLLSSISVAQSATGPVMRTYTIAHDPGNLTGVTNPDGSQYTFGYDANSHMTNENLGGETHAWTYQNGELASMQEGSAAPANLTPANLQGLGGIVPGSQVAVYTDPNGNTTTTILDSQGRPIQQTDALGNVTTWVRNANGYVTSMTDPNGNTTNYEVDAQGYVLQTSYPDGSTESYTYDSLHDILTYTDQNGHTTSYSYDRSGHMLSQTDPLGNTTTYTWADDLMQTMTDPNGGLTQYFYDSARRLIKTIDPMGFQNSTSYDSNGFVASTTDANGNTTTYVNDQMGRVLQMTTALGFLTKSTYDANGNLLTQTDPNGNTTQYVYSDRGLLLTTTDPLGNVTTDSYDPADNLVSTTDPNGHTTQFVYDADNRQTESITSLGFVAHTSYDPDGNVTATTDANGNTTQYVYNSLNRQIETIDPLGNLSKTGYDAARNVINQTDANGNTTTFQFDADNRQVASTDPLGNTSTSQYDPNGNVIAATDANGHTTHFSYDADNRQTSMTDPLGFVSSTQYDPNGNVIATTDPNGNTTHFSYDADNRQSSVTDPLGFVSTTSYDPAGNVVATTDANGNTTHYSFDADNRQVSVTDPLGFVSTTAYDPAGNVIATTDANGHTTHYGFDADNRQVSVTDPLGNQSTTAYDPNGNVIATTDPNGNTTHFSYDADNRQTAVTNALGNTTVTAFDPVGNVISVTDPHGNKTSYTFDADNRQVAMTDPLGNLAIMSYDAVGNLISTTDRDGRITNNTYDADNRLTKTVWIASDGLTVTDTKTFGYDSNGNLLTGTNNAGTYTMTYDADNRLATQTDPHGLTLTYGYDGNGNTISVQDSLGGLTTSLYDGDNRLVIRQFNQTGTQLQIDFTYDGNGNVLTVSRYEGREHPRLVGFTQSTYDADNRVTAIQHQDGKGKVLATYVYTYDAGSRMASQTINGVTTNYRYDAINELTADGANTYSYDANKNRTNPGYVTGANNQLTTDGTWNYSYDPEGNLMQKISIATGETWTYTYNNLNQLTSATDKAADGTLLSQSEYTLDVFGNRVTQAIYTQASGLTTVTQFAYDNAQGTVPNIWADLDASGSLTTRRIFGDALDQPLGRIDSNGIAWYLTDRLGSIRAIANPAGQLIDHIAYDAFGSVVSESDPSAGDRYKFAGMQLNTDGTLYTRWRDDNTKTGRWNQQDPSSVSGANPNLYAYVGNNPVNQTDPTGLQAVPWRPYLGSKTVLVREYTRECKADARNVLMYEFTDKKGTVLLKVYCDNGTIHGQLKKAGVKGETDFGECVADVNAWVICTDKNGSITKIRWFTIMARSEVFGQQLKKEEILKNMQQIRDETKKIIEANANDCEKAEAAIKKYLETAKEVEKGTKGKDFGKPLYRLWMWPEGPLKPRR